MAALRCAVPCWAQDFGEHGRELVSPEIALRLLGALCAGGAELAALAGRAGVGEAELAELLPRTVMKVGGAWAFFSFARCDIFL